MTSKSHRGPLISRAVREGGVCVSLIAVIATILFPVFAQSRPRSGPSCLSNQKQLALGFMAYAQDNEDYFPPAASWQTAVTPYVRNNRAFLCPEVLQKFKDRKSEREKVVNTYALNSRVDHLHQESIREPQRTVLLFESDHNVLNAAGGPALLVVPGRHAGASTFAFADGHAKYAKEGDRQRFGVD